jgi:CTP:molybdopterin cytidylyltransferase MocA
VKRTGVILAAGESRRMGRPKALLDWGGECYLDRLIRIFGAHCEDVVVVLRRGGEQQLGGCGRLRAARIAVNEEPERGQMSSLLAGLAAVEAGREVLFTPVDYGHVREETVAALAQAAAGG